MKGFEISYNGEKINVAVKDGSIIILLYNITDGKSNMYISGVDYSECKRYLWADLSSVNTGLSSVNIGDTFEIKAVNIDNPTPPVKVDTDNIKRPKTKLEIFRELEIELKKQGLL